MIRLTAWLVSAWLLMYVIDSFGRSFDAWFWASEGRDYPFRFLSIWLNGHDYGS
jgi:hypothetical protein